MKKPEITPGKWEIENDKIVSSGCVRTKATTQEKGTVATISFETPNTKRINPSKKEAAANATAISALPDLLEALEGFVIACDTAPPVAFLQHISEVNQQARAALTKAGYTFD